MNIEIIKVDSNHLVELQKIGKQTFYETFAVYNSPENMAHYLETSFSLDKLHEEVTNPDTAFYFAKYDNEIIAYLKLNIGRSQTELQDHQAMEIERIYVLEAFQGKQVGQLLYEKAISIARAKALHYIWLGVWEENKKAIQFYQKNGFEVFDKHVFILGDDEQTDLMMKLILK